MDFISNNGEFKEEHLDFDDTIWDCSKEQTEFNGYEQVKMVKVSAKMVTFTGDDAAKMGILPGK